MKKGSGKKIIIFWVIVFVLILITGIYVLKNNKLNQREKNIAGSLILEYQEDANDKNYSNFLEGNEEDMNSPTIQGSELGCITKQISYSMINLSKKSTCNQYQDDICIDKTTECSIEVHNRDNEIAGFFEIELIFTEEGGNKEIPLDSKTSRFFLKPMTYNVFKDSINIQSTEQDGPANKDITCLFNTLEVPKEKVCH